MNFHIAIPTYRRSELIQKLTLAYLRDCDVDMSRVTLFVSDEQDLEAYAASCAAAGLMPQIVVTGADNLRDKFNFIHRHYAPGERVVLFEDDIKQLSIKVGEEKKLQRWTTIRAEFEGAFAVCAAYKTKLWGVCPFANAFYMKDKVSTNLKFIVANCFGFIATGDPALEVTLDAKSDYERTLLYYMHFNAVVRLNYVAVETKNYTNQGGLQTELDDGRRLAAEQAACQYLTARFPHFISINAKRATTSRYPELSIRNIKDGGQDWIAVQRAHDAAAAGEKL